MILLQTNRNYRLLFSASSISNLGDGVSALAFPWLATLLTRDPFAIALVAMATRLPWLLFSLPAGVWVDRMDRQRLMVQADLFRFGLTLGVIALIFSAGPLPAHESNGAMIWGLAGAAFLLGVAEVFRDNAAQTMLPSVVEAKDLETANGQIWSAEQIMGSFIGPPLAGILIATAVPIPFAFDALTFGLAAWLVWCISLSKTSDKPIKRSFWVEFREGAVWMYGHKQILQLGLMLGAINMLHMMTATILVLFAQDILMLDAFWYGVLLTAGAAGGVAGGIISPWVAAKIGTHRSLILSLAMFPVQYLIIAFSDDVYSVAIALFFGMIAALLWNVVTVSLRQRVIPSNILGRVNSIYRFFGWGMLPIGALIGGAVVSIAEPSWGREAALRLPFFIAGIGGIVMFAYGAIYLRRT
ncbi:MFS transporter [Cochlodiniinecator piscidefendens]|uniref:MFS transporter n=1 Tax=Cochlodiniinecator piscidefendens TaxID=2715756 RepID=UPI001409560A|nr:MFS transporter [Cochlodiniinecator piscidefendens]